MNSKYIVKGSVRGHISSHRTIAGAIKSLRRDQRACRGLGGGAYSDCAILRADGQPLNDAEQEAIYVRE